MLSVKEGTRIAASIVKDFKYLYGGKGEAYTSKLVKSLAAKYPSKFTAELKAEALKDADKGYKAADCSYLVCQALGLPGMNSLSIKNQAVALFKPDKSKAIEGMALWKNGHVAYIGDGLKIYEMRSTKTDGYITAFEKRASDFTFMFVAKNSALYYEQLNAQLEESSFYYPAYKGKGTSIVSALESVGEKNTSYAHRKRIAQVNGIKDYAGTVKQNLKLVELLKAGKLVKTL